MQTTTLSFGNMHAHGELFTDILRARRESFIVQRKWDLPQVDGMEFDQYDTPNRGGLPFTNSVKCWPEFG